ncbi:MAG: mechanosensitive ion channel domain-containing protein [Patescibacteria group bacterium]
MTLTPEVINTTWQLGTILATLIAGKLIIKYVSDYAIKPLLAKSKKVKTEQKKQTIVRTIHLIGNSILAAIVLVLFLRLFGISLASLATGAGITGLIFGLGAQSLIKDIIAGLFMLLEDQFDIGDTIEVGEIIGEVINVTLRSTVIRDRTGNTCYIPHGNITHIINHTKRK